jgi:hypothetical protein
MSLKETNNNVSTSINMKPKNSNNSYELQQYTKPLVALMELRKNTLYNMITLQHNITNDFYQPINSIHWKLFKSNIELLENKIGKNKYVEFLQPVYVNQTIAEEYDKFLYILHKYETNTEIMALINKVDSMSAISSSTKLKLTSAFSSSTPTKRNHNDMIHDSRSDDENSTSNHNTNKKRRIWLSGEDLVIIKEATSDINDYAIRAAQKLNGRTVESVIARWDNTLKRKNQDEPNNYLILNSHPNKKTYKMWTSEEDNTIIDCYNENLLKLKKSYHIELHKPLETDLIIT